MEEELLYQTSGEETPLSNEVALTENAQQRLLSSAKWMNYLSILAFIFLVLISIPLAWRTLIIFSRGEILPIVIILLAILFFVFYFYLATVLDKCARNIKNAVIQQNQQLIESAFKSQKRLFKIFVIVGFVFWILYLLLYLSFLIF